MKKKNNSSDSGKIAAGVGTVGIGGGILIKSLRKPKNRTVIKEETDKVGNHIYKRAVSKLKALKLARRGELRELGHRSAGWLGSYSRRAFSETKKGMIIKRLNKN